MEATKLTQNIPTVSCILGERIIEIVYDGAARSTSLVVACNGQWTLTDEFVLDSGETLVPYAATNNLIQHGAVVLPSEPVDHSSKDSLVEEISTYLRRYLDLPPIYERLAAYYVLLTWVHDAFNEVPYLRFQGDYGTGKTRALIALGSIAYKGFFASGASTVSPVFHTLDRFGGTLILDEADLRFSDKTADMVKILNNGTVKGLPVLRTVQNRHKEFNPAAFHVFGPKIIAMRGRFRDQALESRFLTVEMASRTLRSDIPIQLPDTLKTEALELRNRLLHFRLTSLSAIKSQPERLIPGVDPRLNQTALSLLSLVDDNSLRDQIASMMQAKQAQLTADRARSIEVRTTEAVERLFSDVTRDSISLRELGEAVNTGGDDLDDPVSPRQVGNVLRNRSISLRKSNGAVLLDRAAWR